MRKIRRMPGLFPSADTGFRFVQDVKHGDEVWAVYHRVTDGYDNFKLCVYGRAEHKGNYWLSWKDGQLVPSDDYRALRENRPVLHEEALKIVDKVLNVL